jgi:hypothetical protein
LLNVARRHHEAADSARRALEIDPNYHLMWRELGVAQIISARYPMPFRVLAVPSNSRRAYPTGCVVSRAEMNTLALHPRDFHGDWNYELRPRPS